MNLLFALTITRVLHFSSGLFQTNEVCKQMPFNSALENNTGIVSQKCHNTYNLDSTVHQHVSENHHSSHLLDDFESPHPVSPPVNSIYDDLAMKIPVLGKQHFQLKILSDKVAHLIINGMLQVNDVVS